jgi:lipocalin
MFKILLILATLSSINHINAVSPGNCKDIPVNPAFDVAAYVGKWYQIEKVNAPFEPTLKCVTANYAIYNASTILVDNAGLKP